VSYYSDPDRASSSGQNTSIPKPTFGESRTKQPPHLRASTMRFLTVPDASAFQKDAASALGKVLEKIDNIELVRMISLLKQVPTKMLTTTVS
jgi:hypothetical protein